MAEAAKVEASKKVLVEIPKEIPRDLFLSISMEDYCSQLIAKRLEARRKKHGENAELPHRAGGISMDSLVSAVDEARTQKISPQVQNSSKEGLFANPTRGAVSVVALLVVGIACYSTYFGA